MRHPDDALRKAAEAALRIIQLRRNVGNTAFEEQAIKAEKDLRAALAAEPVQLLARLQETLDATPR